MFRAMVMAFDNQKIEATVVVNKKKLLDYNEPNDLLSGPLDTISELLGQKISLRLVSADKSDPSNESGGKIGAPAYLKNWNLQPLLGDLKFRVMFEWSEDFGTPGAILVRNSHPAEFYLKTVTLEKVPGRGQIHFICNSWIYNERNYKTDRVFFANMTFLPHEMPQPLHKYREDELRTLRGDGEGELKEWDRVYDYALYNDLGDPEKDPAHKREVLGGNSDFPYPRRGRTGRPPSKSDSNTESRKSVGGLFSIYVPRDEQFGHSKKSDFLAYNLKALVSNIIPAFQAFADLTPNEFDSFKEVDNLFFDGIQLPTESLNRLASKVPIPIVKEMFRSDGEQLLKFPVPQLIKDRSKPTSAWRTDEEFAREMIAGLNPLIIRLLEEFPPTSQLDPASYGNQHSFITEEDIEYNLDGLSVEEALRSNRLFILDHHDTVMPYLSKINATSSKSYASRTLLFLRGDSTLKPVAIELSLPNPRGDNLGAVSKVYTPAEHGVEASIWQLAKAFVAVNDSGYHQVICHWLHTHAVIEPFVIATNRQLSVVHPIYKLLHPHYRDTMTINALARETLVNAGGLVESTFFSGKYSLEMSSQIYRSWNFLDQALPNDLKKRGIAVEDANSPHGLRLLISDYPYAVDGLKIWFAIEKWVKDYCSFYYKTDEMIQQDPELQAWWKELREVGHGDLKDEPWWPKMQSLDELIQSCTIIIWIASALHAAVNFGQYAYAAYAPNRPTLSRRLMPKEGSREYAELEKNPQKAFFRTMASQVVTLTGITIVEALSRHASDEVYLGQRDSPNWTADAIPLRAFEAFYQTLGAIEEEIMSMNKDKRLKNRTGPVNVPYTLLYPTGKIGFSGKGIPNSISI